MLAWSVLALLLVVGGALGWWWVRSRRSRARRPQRPVKPHLPIVLAHGVLGFDEVGVGKLRQSYFRGVPEALRAMGAEVHLVKMPPLAGIEARAEALARAVRSIDAERVNIIAHSMGGLDARYAISRLGLSAKVASLTTVGTPHRGTPLADLGTGLLGEKLKLRFVLEKLGIGFQAFYDLTTARLEHFNREVPDVRGVAYGAFVAHVRRPGAPWLLPPFMFLTERAGENDGMVPATSQGWGELLGRIEADHWAQIGWSRGFDAPAFYAEVFRDLRGRGL